MTPEQNLSMSREIERLQAIVAYLEGEQSEGCVRRITGLTTLEIREMRCDAIAQAKKRWEQWRKENPPQL